MKSNVVSLKVSKVGTIVSTWSTMTRCHGCLVTGSCRGVGGGGHQKWLLKFFQWVPKDCGGAVLCSDVSIQERQAAVPGNEGLFALHFHHSLQAYWVGNSLVISAGEKAVWTQEGIISFDFKEIAKD